MSTRCMIHFTEDGVVEVNIYRHFDGYPDSKNGVLADLKKFFKDVKSQTDDTRFDDASYLAAKFVVWQAHQNIQPYTHDEQPKEMLDFLGLGIAKEDHADVEYIYTVECNASGKLPKVTYKKVLQSEFALKSSGEGSFPEVTRWCLDASLYCPIPLEANCSFRGGWWENRQSWGRISFQKEVMEDEEEKPPTVEFIVTKKSEHFATPKELQVWVVWILGLEKVQNWQQDLDSPADKELTYHVSLN